MKRWNVCAALREAEGHIHEFVQSERCRDCCFRDVFGCDWDLVESAHQINRREDGAASKVLRKVLNVRHGDTGRVWCVR
jgi:hypothetical protein